MLDYNHAYAFVAALTGGQVETTVLDWRMIHDADKGIPAIPFRDTLPRAWHSIEHYQSQGYGAFAVIAAMDGVGRELANVVAIRAHYVDLDNPLTAPMSLDRARQWYPLPSFGVNTSPEKFHVYWPVQPYAGNDRFQIIQRKLRQVFDGDRSVIDATRVMRLPGTLNTKYSNPASEKYTGAAPHLVTCFGLPGYGNVPPVEMLEAALTGVNVIDGGGSRHELGDPALAAPSLDWIRYGLSLLNPNDLDRGEWISLTAAIKQSGWSLVTQEQQIFDIWAEWCARYDKNDLAENWKQWNSIRQTEVGWNHIVRKAPGLHAMIKLGPKPEPQPTPEQQPAATPAAAAPALPASPPSADCSGEILTHIEQQTWFRGCIYVEDRGEILTPSLTFMGPGMFNASYGGKEFIIRSTGKTTDEAWKAATRSTLWRLPKAHHIRFLPAMPFGGIVEDELQRKGVNMFRPAIIKSEAGDVTPWLRHMELMIPVESDRYSYYEFLAHAVKYPGSKIPWAPMLQSTEGAGKTAIGLVVEHVLGRMYTYQPPAPELVKSSATFNAWQRGKLMIIVNEIKVDERRELIEILKPMISDERIQIQAKGENQVMEDNPANWLFFSNYKDAIPINKNGRRYAIFYSAIQSHRDLIERGMNGAYFSELYRWVKNEGAPRVAHWLLNYPVERDAIPQRAPDTSSMIEAERISRGSLDQMMLDAIEDQVAGFRAGWFSIEGAIKLIKAKGGKVPASRTLGQIAEQLGYVLVGRSPIPYFQEDMTTRSTLYSRDPNADVTTFATAQGYDARA